MENKKKIDFHDGRELCFYCKKSRKEVKQNAGFRRSIENLHHHNWYQVEFGDVFELLHVRDGNITRSVKVPLPINL